MTPPQENIPYGYCHCGCGQKTSLVKSSNKTLGVTRGEPRRFISGHNTVPEFMSEVKTRHGHGGHGNRRSSTYSSWVGMKSRCLNPKDKNFRYYGGRGITICERWMTFENFLADMGEKPTRLTIDRKNNDGNYEPGNCRWATVKQQNRNKRGNNRLLWQGRCYTVTELAEVYGMVRSTLQSRLRKGMSLDQAINTPIDERHSYAAKC